MSPCFQLLPPSLGQYCDAILFECHFGLHANWRLWVYQITQQFLNFPSSFSFPLFSFSLFSFSLFSFSLFSFGIYPTFPGPTVYENCPRIDHIAELRKFGDACVFDTTGEFFCFWNKIWSCWSKNNYSMIIILHHSWSHWI